VFQTGQSTKKKLQLPEPKVIYGNDPDALRRAFKTWALLIANKRLDNLDNGRDDARNRRAT
jgi:hypothetical protein